MGPTLVRARFAVLWLVVAGALIATAAVFFYEPGVLAGGVAGVMEGDPVTAGTALQMAAMAAVPLTLAAVTLFVPARANAITNLVAGALLGAGGLFLAVSELAAGTAHAHLTLAVFASLAAWLIAGLGAAELRRLSHGHGGPSVRVEFSAHGLS